MNPDQKFGIIMTFMILTIVPLVLIFGIPVAKSFARRLERGNPPDDHAAELEELRHRVAELEERVDFSERLLAQVEQERLKG